MFFSPDDRPSSAVVDAMELTLFGLTPEKERA
jgi:hypothetical protein